LEILKATGVKIWKPSLVWYGYFLESPNGQNLYPILDQNGSKTIPFGAAHTYIANIKEYPPLPRAAILAIAKHL